MNTLLQITIGDDGKAQFFSDYASLEDELSVQISVRQKAEPYHGPHPDVAEDLILWRRAKARELNVPPYFILHQKVLHAIADLKPSTREELTMVPGFGEKMFDKYGKDILEITTL